MTTKTSLNLFELQNKLVIVTGAGLIGTEIIKGLAEAGAKVIFVDIDDKKGKILETKFKKLNLDIIFKNLDISDEELVKNFILDCKNEYEKIDGWINTAYPKTIDWEKKSNY